MNKENALFFFLNAEVTDACLFEKHLKYRKTQNKTHPVFFCDHLGVYLSSPFFLFLHQKKKMQFQLDQIS